MMSYRSDTGTLILAGFYCKLLFECLCVLFKYPNYMTLLSEIKPSDVSGGALKKFLIERIYFFPSETGVSVLIGKFFDQRLSIAFFILSDILQESEASLTSMYLFLRLVFWNLFIFDSKNAATHVLSWLHIVIVVFLELLRKLYKLSQSLIQDHPLTKAVEYLHLTLWKLCWLIVGFSETQILMHALIYKFSDPQYESWPAPLPNAYNFEMSLASWIPVFIGLNILYLWHLYMRRWVIANEILYTTSAQSVDVWKRVLIK